MLRPSATVDGLVHLPEKPARRPPALLQAASLHPKLSLTIRARWPEHCPTRARRSPPASWAGRQDAAPPRFGFDRPLRHVAGIGGAALRPQPVV